MSLSREIMIHWELRFRDDLSSMENQPKKHASEKLRKKQELILLSKDLLASMIISAEILVIIILALSIMDNLFDLK